MYTIPSFLNMVLPVLAGLYLFVIMIRVFALVRLFPFFGKYGHITPPGETPDDVTFTVSYDWARFLSPVPGVTIKIRRSSAKDSLYNDWHGWFTSNIVFLYYFKGRYELDNPVPGEPYGWHHLSLFDKPDIRIVMNLLHVKDNRQIVSDEGYYIVKK